MTRKKLRGCLCDRVCVWLQEEGISLELSTRNTYEEVSHQLAGALKGALSDPLCLRFTQQNTYSQQPKPSPLRHPGQADTVLLPEMLAQFNHAIDTLFYEILDLPLPQLEQLKTLKASPAHASALPSAICICSSPAFPNVRMV